MHDRRRAIAGRYATALTGQEAIQLPIERYGTQHAWHIYAIRLHLDRLTINRDRFIEELRRRNIGASVHFIPIHMLSYYRDKYGYRPEDLPVASREFERLISLPIHSRMTDADVDDVIEAIADIAHSFRR
jgi:dTDP-4-amino-4,6-dideoxygalactose transaminase